MKITFIRPHLTHKRSTDALEPLVFAVLARLTPPDVELAVYDDRLEPIPFDEPTDLVAITIETFTAKRAYQIAAKYRQRGVPVVVGGFHPTLVPDEAQRYADSVVIGDAENVWAEIVRDARAGQLKPRYRSAAPPALQGLRPDRSIFPKNRYKTLRLVQFGRGCRFACDFCSVHAVYGSTLHQRCLDDVIAEIDGIRRSYLLFVDDNLFVNESQAEELFRALLPLKAHWICQTSVDLAQNSRLLDLMARSGCIAVFIGFESLNEANLAQMRKKWNLKQGDFAEAVRQFYEHGIMVCGSFVFGYDGDAPTAFDRTLDFAMRSRLALAQFNPLIPTPGTPLYQRLQAEGRLLYPSWWLDDDYRYGQAIFTPQNMSANELTEGCFRLRRDFNSYGSIFQRALTPQSNARSPHHLLAYLAANLVSRKEIFSKQWEPLGDGSTLMRIIPTPPAPTPTP
ncbi:MAG: radical SAM protein [Anaerolineales bacterium]